MHKFIIFLSILFFALAAFVMFKAAGISARNQAPQSAPAASSPERSRDASADILNQYEKERKADREMVEQLQSTIASLENRLSDVNTAAGTAGEEKGLERESKVLAVLGGGTFSAGQVVINEELMDTVTALVDDISEHPGHRVVIEGHTDNIPISPTAGSRYRDNMDLSFLRAKSVARILIAQGIARERISVIGYGDTRPIASNDDNEGRAKNRRVEVKLVPEEKGR